MQNERHEVRVAEYQAKVDEMTDREKRAEIREIRDETKIAFEEADFDHFEEDVKRHRAYRNAAFAAEWRLVAIAGSIEMTSESYHWVREILQMAQSNWERVEEVRPVVNW